MTSARVDRYDVVVVGSGFGGAVVAARLAEAGRSVCLLEQGRRWEPASYPRSFGQSAAAVWDGQRHFGFLEYRVFSRLDVIQGVGVGGGSLHYFNVQMRAPAVIFERPEWPAAITRGTLDPYYDRVAGMLTPAPLTPPPGETLPERTRAFMGAARRAGYKPELVPLAIHTGATRDHPVSGLTQQPCAYDSGCLLGCRTRSKNSLDVTYLPLGERHGLEIRPLHAAERIEPDPGGEGYLVTARVIDPDGSGPAAGTVTARTAVAGQTVILAAGSLGSTHLLLRARDRVGTLPRISPALGRRFSGNGDMLFAATANAQEETHPSRGPSITAGAFVQPPGSPHLVQIQDLGYPGALLGLFDATFPTGRRLKAVGRGLVGYVRAARRGEPFPAAELFGGSPIPNLLPYLGMGTDAADGHLRVDSRGRLRLRWDPAASEPMMAEMQDAMQALSSALGGTYLRSALWRKPLKRLLTAHPLGGCAMGDSPASGVVDHRGEVFGYPGLYVADGSVMPGPLAVNPSATIAALAERTAEGILHRG